LFEIREASSRRTEMKRMMEPHLLMESPRNVCEQAFAVARVLLPRNSSSLGQRNQ